MSADSETASYTSATALSGSERQPCPIAGGACKTGCVKVAVCGDVNRRVGTTVATANLSPGNAPRTTRLHLSVGMPAARSSTAPDATAHRQMSELIMDFRSSFRCAT